MTRVMDVDGRCDGDWDEYQGSESGNKPLRLGLSGEIAPSPLSMIIEAGVSWNKLRASDKSVSLMWEWPSTCLPEPCDITARARITKTVLPYSKSMWGAWCGSLGFSLNPSSKSDRRSEWCRRSRIVSHYDCQYLHGIVVGEWAPMVSCYRGFSCINNI